MSQIHTIAYLDELDDLVGQQGDLAVSTDGVLYCWDGGGTWILCSGVGSAESPSWICAYCDRTNTDNDSCPGCGAPKGSHP